MVNGLSDERSNMAIEYTVHQDDGTGHCTTCGTSWPAECEVEKNTVWVAEVTGR